MQAGLVIGSAVCDEEFTEEDSTNAQVFKQIPDFNKGEVLFLGFCSASFLHHRQQ